MPGRETLQSPQHGPRAVLLGAERFDDGKGDLAVTTARATGSLLDVVSHQGSSRGFDLLDLVTLGGIAVAPPEGDTIVGTHAAGLWSAAVCVLCLPIVWCASCICRIW